MPNGSADELNGSADPPPEQAGRAAEASRAVIAPHRSSDIVNLAILAAGWIVMALLINPVGDFPLNDDWVYAGSAKAVYERGYFWIPGPAIPNLFPLAYWGALFCLPFGFSFTALRISSLVLGLVGVLAIYGVLRRLGARPFAALLGAAVLAVNPLWLSLANGFMTDVPFLTMTMLAVLCLIIGVNRASFPATLGGVALALVAVLIRQTGLFLTVGLAVAHPFARAFARPFSRAFARPSPRAFARPSPRAFARLFPRPFPRGFHPASLIVGAIPLLLAALLHIGFQHWILTTGRAPDAVLGGVHELIPASLGAFAVSSIRATIVMIPYLGAFVFPFVILTERVSPAGVGPRQERIGRIVLVILAVLFLAWIVWKDDGMPVLQNLIISGGVGPLSLRYVLRTHVPEVPLAPIVSHLWLVVDAVGVCGAFLLIDRLIRNAIDLWAGRRSNGGPDRRSNGGGWAWAFVLAFVSAAAYWGAILLLVHWDSALYDRYILYLLPFAMIAVMASPRTRLTVNPRSWRALAAMACLLVYAAFAVTGTHDYLAWNRARWRALDDLIAQGVAPNRIDGGYEFDGWTERDPRYQPRTSDPYWWGDGTETYAIGYQPLDGYHEVARYEVARWLPSTYPAILVLRRSDATR